MCDLDDLLAASSDAVLNAKPDPVLPCKAKPTVAPRIAIAAPKIVLVKPAYQAKGHRLSVTVGTDVAFSGTGTLDVAPAGQLRVYDSKGTLQATPLAVPGAKLKKGVTFFVEGATPSAALNATTLSFSLADGDKTIINSPATDALTCVEVNLDLCQYKAALGGADPAPVADKIAVGRNLHVQTPDLWAGRALLIVKQAKPAAYAGNVVLKARGGRVRTFAYGLERPMAGQVAQADPLPTANAALGPAGLKLWVEGVTESSKILDSGFVAEISDLPGVEGDRANITVVKASIAVYDRPKKPGAKPSRLSDAAKLNPGRSLHVQNAAKDFARAKIVVQRVKPASWVGNLEVQVWDVATDSAVNPRLSLFTAEPAGSPAHANPLAHSPAYPKDGTPLWVEGTRTSAALLDAQLRVRVADAEGYADRGALTVHKLFVKEVKFSGVVDIYYARIPHAGSYLLPPAAEPVRSHLIPAEVRPAAGTPHWRKKPAQDPLAEFSWPAVYARKKASGVPSPTLEATFELYPKVPGNITAKISADGGASGVKLEEKDVTFAGGDAAGISFAIKGLPNTVKQLDGMEFQWKFDGPAHKTQHTLFIVDQKPQAANNAFDDEYLWEIFEWSCRWADGTSGTTAVFAAIWAKFNPAAAAHDTGLVYWKNWNAFPPIHPAQDLATAIQSQDHLNPAKQNAASCIVFDRVLMNCIGAHGVYSAEIKLTPPPGQFTRAATQYTCSGWLDTTTVGQGNPAAPPNWGSHWIAVAKVGGDWKFYDASYGAGPVKAPTPGAAPSTLDVLKFEPHTVASFDCEEVLPPYNAVSLLRDPSPAAPPHLVGRVLWTNK